MDARPNARRRAMARESGHAARASGIVATPLRIADAQGALTSDALVSSLNFIILVEYFFN